MELTWSIYRIQSFPLFDNKQNVVSTVSWNVTGNDGQNQSAVSGVTTLKIGDLSNFIAYEQLTQEQIVEWVQTSLGTEKINSIQRQIDIDIANKKQNPQVVPIAQEKPLPWVTTGVN